MRIFRSYPSAGGQFQELFPARSRDEFAPGLPVRNLDAGTGTEIVVGDRTFQAVTVETGDAFSAENFAPAPNEPLSFIALPASTD
ncbi:hypothetical protein C2E25_02380 [Geothermobacter hydrogeniphilus]|uniref:Uncharacterized protein n=1 Tax=Geothermobacter hydrogeniphilus TaxID=1969733 RepID=A0A2K2HDP3_9BACT|nr:hypothetical protein [Geothermobacter hydrogeniphilus]PNU21422.1 hypothetical protein C2E25_02380 [Geothermobacter hydrogeniphilus]